MRGRYHTEEKYDALYYTQVNEAAGRGLGEPYRKDQESSSSCKRLSSQTVVALH